MNNKQCRTIDCIINYIVDEFGQNETIERFCIWDDMQSHNEIGLAFTTIGENETEIQVNYDFWNEEIKVYLDYELDNTIKVNDITDYLEFDYLITLYNRDLD